MIHLIMGLKGSGKTKKMIDSIQEAIAIAKPFASWHCGIEDKDL